MAVENLDDRLGSILIGTWINVMLYMLEVVQACIYFTSSDIYQAEPLAIFRSTDTFEIIQQTNAFAN
ncbi:hypothetical protein VKT23_012647 [Stygiomarasmius scandens]|uniref:Uncharacterized protein n=1 Tax=Marasmiellus scandens TaxID=2682957 RepID=A0ABR1J8D4_9AGAR